MCFMSKLFNANVDCGKYGNICIRSCGKCTGPKSQICMNLKDRALDCRERDCQDSNLEQRHRNHIKCSRTCCDKNKLY